MMNFVRTLALIVAAAVCPARANPPGATQVNVTVDTLANRHAISPYIYGMNFPSDASYIQNSGMVLARWGADQADRYN